MTTAPSAESLRDTIMGVLARSDMDAWLFYEENVNDAFDKGDTDRLEMILWYFTDYWGSGPARAFALNSFEDGLFALRRDRGYKFAAHLFTVKSVYAVRDFGAAVGERPSKGDGLIGYQEMINEIFIRPEAGPVMAHLVCERGITDWKDIEPMLDGLLSSEAPVLTRGIL
jgi:hypothetical protein